MLSFVDSGELTMSNAGRRREKHVAANMTPALNPVVAFWKRGDIFEKPIAGNAPIVVAIEVVKNASKA